MIIRALIVDVFAIMRICLYNHTGVQELHLYQPLEWPRASWYGAQRDKLRGVAVSNPISRPNLIKVNDLYKIVNIKIPAMTT